MEDYKNNFARNIVYLRKQRGITQAQLAQSLSYTDKAVSKWERGESMPDIAAMIQISEMFNVPIDCLIRDLPLSSDDKCCRSNKIINKNRTIIALLSVMLVFLLATIVFVVLGLLKILPLGKLSLIYIYAIPAASIVLLVFNSIWGKGGLNYAIITLLLWSLLFGIYYNFTTENLWLIFLLGIPSQIIIFLWANLKKNPVEADNK